MGFLSGYTQRKPITVDNTYIDSALTDFPLLIDWYYDTDMVPGTDIDTDGYNLRFTSDDGETLLDYDRRVFQPLSGPDGASFTGFVRMPSLSAVVDTDIYLYYRADSPSDGEDKAGVWQDYKGVWPLDESSGNALDVSGNSHTLTDVNSVGSGAGLFSNYARDFESTSSQRLTKSDHADLSCGDIDFTFECLFNLESLPTINGIAGKGTAGGTQTEWFFFTFFSKWSFQVYYGGSARTADVTAISPATGVWYQAFGWHSASSNQIGLQINLTTTTVAHSNGVNDGTEDFVLGRVLTYDFDGLMSEARFRKSVYTADWRKFQYHNIFEADHEISIGTEETGGSSGVEGAASDTLTLTDATSNTLAASKSAADTLTLVDATSNTLVTSQTTADSLALTDATSCYIAVSGAVSESLAITDAVTCVRTIPATVSETLTLTDTTVNTLTSPQTQSETLTLTDEAAVTLQAALTVSDALTFTDEALGDVEGVTTVADTLALTDSTTSTLTSTQTLAGTLTLTDTASASNASSQEASDTVTLSDTTTATSSRPAAASETFTLTDAAGAILASNPTLAETLTLADSLEETLQAYPTLPETLTLSDTATVSITFFAVVEDSLVFSDLTVAAGEIIPDFYITLKGPTTSSRRLSGPTANSLQLTGPTTSTLSLSNAL